MRMKIFIIQEMYKLSFKYISVRNTCIFKRRYIRNRAFLRRREIEHTLLSITNYPHRFRCRGWEAQLPGTGSEAPREGGGSRTCQQTMRTRTRIRTLHKHTKAHLDIRMYKHIHTHHHTHECQCKREAYAVKQANK